MACGCNCGKDRDCAEKETREINLGKGIIEVNGEKMQAANIKAEWAEKYAKEMVEQFERDRVAQLEKERGDLRACPFQTRVVWNPKEEKLDLCQVFCPMDERCMSWGLSASSGMEKRCRLIP